MAAPSGSRKGAAVSQMLPTAQSSGDSPRAPGVSKYLADLPSRGLFSSTVLASHLGGVRVYVCQHDTSPPEEQLIKTDSTNILIRSLQLNKQRADTKDGKANAKSTADSNKSKRAADRTCDGRASAKKANVASASTSSKREGSKPFPPYEELHTFTVERLRALLKERGLSAKGKKDELIMRLTGE